MSPASGTRPLPSRTRGSSPTTSVAPSRICSRHPVDSDPEVTRIGLRTKLLADTILGTDTAFELIEEIAAIPGVKWSHAPCIGLRGSIGAIRNLHLYLYPLSTSSSEFDVDRFEPPTDHGAFIAYRAAVEPEFFEVVGIEILRGRNFNDADRPDTQPVVIIGEAMARRCWTDGDAVGRLVRRREDDPPWLVVGMASDAKVRTLGEAPRNMVYLPYSQRFTPLLTVVARTPIRPGAGRRA